MKGEKYTGYILTDNDWGKVGKKHVFNTFKVFFANEQRNIRLLYKRDLEDSFTGQFIKAEFETFGIGFNYGKSVFMYKKEISPTTNWFGTSKYEPDTIFKKGETEMVMSLQGIATPYNERYAELFDNRSVRYIRIKKDNKTLYEDWTGNLPPKELVNQILN